MHGFDESSETRAAARHPIISKEEEARRANARETQQSLRLVLVLARSSSPCHWSSCGQKHDDEVRVALLPAVRLVGRINRVNQ
jgi:hypothetical protein